MNLLKVQDALKNASDQQLMGLMQSPDSTAPSYLVLSEIRRRKDMRNKQAPEGQSNRTVADDLLAQDDGGIRDIVAHDEPEAQDGADEMAAGGLASLRRYAEGGVVRMQAGGELPRRPLSEMSPEELRILRRQFDFGAFSERMPNLPGARPVGRPQYTLEELAAEDFRRRNLTRPNEPSRFIEDPESAFANRSPDQMSVQTAAPAQPAVTTEPVRPVVARPEYLAPSPDADRDAAMGRIPPAPTTTTATQPPPARPARPAGNQPAPPAATTAAPGLDGLRNAAQGAEPSQSSVQFTDRLSPLFERMREGRIDPAARRNEALNMALIEAGLRIASSRNPSLAGAIGEGAAPAVQSYGQQLSQIRQDQRQDIRDELQGALAQNQNDYYRGRLSQQEFATRQQLIIERIRQDREDARTGVREAGATARNEATIAGANRSPEAQRLWQFMFPGQTFDPNNANHMEGMNRILGRGRDPDQAMDIARLRNDAAVEQRLANAYLRDPEITSLSRRLESVATLPGAEGDRMRAMLRQQLDAARGRVRQELAATSSASPATPPLSPGSGGAQVYTPPGSR